MQFASLPPDYGLASPQYYIIQFLKINLSLYQSIITINLPSIYHLSILSQFCFSGELRLIHCVSRILPRDLFALSEFRVVAFPEVPSYLCRVKAASDLVT